MRISDWSSDVCSSDLLAGLDGDQRAVLAALAQCEPEDVVRVEVVQVRIEGREESLAEGQTQFLELPEIRGYGKVAAAAPAVLIHGEKELLKESFLGCDDQHDLSRSEERRVGDERVSTCRFRWWASH